MLTHTRYEEKEKENLFLTPAPFPTLLHFSPPFISLKTNRMIKDIFISSMTKDRSTKQPKFNLTGVRTHDLQIMTVHFMSLRCLV